MVVRSAAVPAHRKQQRSPVPAVLVTLVVGVVTAGSVSLSSAFRHDEGLPDTLDLAVTETSTMPPPTRSSHIPPQISPTAEPATTQERAAAPTSTTNRAKASPPPAPLSPTRAVSRSTSRSAPPSPPAALPSPSSSTRPTTRQSSQPQRVVEMVNAERAEAGCGPLAVDPRLVTAAQLHSQDMAANDYFSHTSQDGRTFADRIRAAGYPDPAAENIAQGQRSAEQVMQAWMNSSGHRANILDCGLTTIGVGLASDGWYWTQDFGS
jgi:uncharacterized protein YkwD